MGIRSLLGRSDKRTGFDEEDKSGDGVLKALLSLIASIIENAFSGSSRNAYLAVILSAVPFNDASKEAKAHIENAGGVAAFLHGSCAIYEVIGVIGIVSVCTTASFFILENAGILTDPSNATWSVPDTWAVTLVICLAITIISYVYLSIFGIVMDSMLYTSAWVRRLNMKEGYNKGDMGKDEDKGKSINETRAPQSLRTLLGSEIVDDPDNFPLPLAAGWCRWHHTLHAVSSLY